MKYTRHEFSKVCGIPNNTLTIMAKRGKIAINSARCANCENKKKPCANCKALEFIDLDFRSKDGFYINLDFFRKNTQGLDIKSVKPEKEISTPVMVSAEAEEPEEETAVSFIDISEQSSDDRLTRAKKFHEILNKKADTRLKELNEAKLRGELIPVDLVQEMIQIFAESIKRSYSDAGENLIMIISERLNAQEHDKAFMRAKLLESTNRAIDDSVNNAQEKLKPETDEL